MSAPVLLQAPFPVTHKSSLAAACCVSLTGIRLGAVWRAEDGKYVLNLLLCPTADPRAWERCCLNLCATCQLCSELLGACCPSISLSFHPLLHVPLHSHLECKAGTR